MCPGNYCLLAKITLSKYVINTLYLRWLIMVCTSNTQITFILFIDLVLEWLYIRSLKLPQWPTYFHGSTVNLFTVLLWCGWAIQVYPCISVFTGVLPKFNNYSRSIKNAPKQILFAFHVKIIREKNQRTCFWTRGPLLLKKNSDHWWSLEKMLQTGEVKTGIFHFG